MAHGLEEKQSQLLKSAGAEGDKNKEGVCSPHAAYCGPLGEPVNRSVRPLSIVSGASQNSHVYLRVMILCSQMKAT